MLSKTTAPQSEKLTIETLKQIELIRKQLIKENSIKIDIKPLKRSEVDGALAGITSSEFFNGWGFWAIRNGKQKIFYGEEFWETRLSQEMPIEKYSIERVVYYLHKLRKILQGQEHLFHNKVKMLDATEKNKIAISCIKNVLVFQQAMKGIGVYTNDELLESLDGELKELLVRLFKRKSENVFDVELVGNFYDKLEASVGVY